jgi:CHRD domain
MSRLWRLCVLVLGSLLVAGTAAAGSSGGPRAEPPVITPTGVQFVVNMDGSQVPDGDPDGQGKAFVDITVATTTVCFRVVVRNIELPTTDGHIHDGDPGINGPVVVRMAGPDATGTSRGCTTGWDPVLLQDIIDNPGGYYVNIHNAPYPSGAIRGQMG